MSPRLDALESLTIPKLSTIREQAELTVTSRPRFGRSVSVAFEGKGTVHDFLRFLKNERFRHMPHDGSSWDKVLKWADNIGGVVLLSVGILSEFMLNSEEATRLICDSCTSLIQVRAQCRTRYSKGNANYFYSLDPCTSRHFTKFSVSSIKSHCLSPFLCVKASSSSQIQMFVASSRMHSRNSHISHAMSTTTAWPGAGLLYLLIMLSLELSCYTTQHLSIATLRMSQSQYGLLVNTARTSMCAGFETF